MTAVYYPKNHVAITGIPLDYQTGYLKQAVTDRSGKVVFEHKLITKKVSVFYEAAITDFREAVNQKLDVPKYTEKHFYPPVTTTLPPTPEQTFGVMQYELNIIEEGTGEYYPVKTIRRSGVTPANFATAGSTLGVVLSLVLLLTKKEDLI